MELLLIKKPVNDNEKNKLILEQSWKGVSDYT